MAGSARGRRRGELSRYVYWSSAALAVVATVLASGVTGLLRPGVWNLRVIFVSLVGESLILSIIAFLAAIIPIVFSVSTLAIQHAASNYTASVLEQYKKDRRTWFFYGFLGFGVLLAASMLIAGSSLIEVAVGDYVATISLLNSSFAVLAFSLLLLPLQLLHVVDLIDPKFIVAQAEEEAVRSILSTPAKIQATIRKAQHGDELERMMAKVPFYPDFAFEQNQDTLLRVAKEKVLQIMDIAFKSALKKEAETYGDSFQAIGEIARTYASVRKSSSGSEDAFLQQIYGKLVSMKKAALDAGDETLLSGIITTLGAIGSATAEIKPASTHDTNLMASLAMLHIEEIAAGAIKNGLWDPAADALRSIRNIGVSALLAAKYDGSASKKVLRLAKEAIRAREWYLSNRASRALNDLLLASVQARVDPVHAPAHIMECIEEFSTFAIKNGMQWEGLSGLFPVMPQYSLERVVRSALEFKNEPHKDLETAYREGYAHEISSSVLDLLIHVGVEAAEKKSSMVMAYAADTIRRTALLLMAEKSKHGFDEEVRKAVGGLAGIYQHADDCPLLDHVPKSLMEIALNSIDATRDNITLSVIGAIQQMTVETMSWDKHGYDTQRLAGRLIVAGSYAANAQNKVVADACLKGLTQFDTAYARKYGKPKELLQLSEAQELHDAGGLPLEEWQDKYRKMPQDALDQFIVSYKNAKPVKR